MKMEQFHVGQLALHGPSGKEVTILAIDGGHASVCLGDVGTYWQPFTTLTPLEPRRGDRVRVVAIAPNSRFHELGVTVGAELTLRTLAPPTMGIDRGWPMVCTEEHPHLAPYGRVVLLSRASPPAEVKDEPPVKRLPAGTRFRFGSTPCEFVEEAVLKDGYWVGAHKTTDNGVLQASKQLSARLLTVEIQPAPASAGEAVAAGWVPKVGDWVEGKGVCDGTRITGCVSSLVSNSLWKTPNVKLEHAATAVGQSPFPLHVRLDSLKPISPPPAGSAEAPTQCPGAEAVTKPVGGGSLKPDPYRKATITQCAHDRVSLLQEHCLDCGATFLEIKCNGKPRIEFVEWRDEQNRIAASRKLAQTKRATDRPVLEQHPREWPEGAGDEQELCVS